MNKIILTGRITKDIELKETAMGTPFVHNTLAVYRTKVDDKEITDFINVTIWSKTAEYMANNLHKGDKILVEGKLQSNKYTDKEGIEKVVWEVFADKVEYLSSPNKNNALSSEKPLNLKHDSNGAVRFEDVKGEIDDGMPF